MKKIEFVREVLSSDPAWEMDLYRSKDVNGTFCSERGCLAAVVLDQGLVEEGIVDVLIESELDRILIENDVYVVFVEE